MMKTWGTAMGLVVGVSTLACGSSDGATTTSPATASPCVGATPGSVGPGKFEADYATSPAFFTQMNGLDQGASVHKSTQIWYSCNLYGLLDKPTLDVPAGSVAIKLQDRGGSGVPDGMRVLIKGEPGTDAAHGDLTYEARTADGTYQSDRGPSFCFGCHQGYAATGYLAGTSITD